MIQPQDSDIIMYQTVDGLTKIDVQMSTETVWLTREQMAELFQRDRSVIGKHIRNIFNKGELRKESVWAKFAHTAEDGKTYHVDYYNLYFIISVGYKIKSLRGTQFRILANSVLKEYLLKGVAMNDDLLKKAGVNTTKSENYCLPAIHRYRSLIPFKNKLLWRYPAVFFKYPAEIAAIVIANKLCCLRNVIACRQICLCLCKPYLVYVTGNIYSILFLK